MSNIPGMFDPNGGLVGGGGRVGGQGCWTTPASSQVHLSEYIVALHKDCSEPAQKIDSTPHFTTQEPPEVSAPEGGEGGGGERVGGQGCWTTPASSQVHMSEYIVALHKDCSEPAHKIDSTPHFTTQEPPEVSAPEGGEGGVDAEDTPLQAKSHDGKPQ